MTLDDSGREAVFRFLQAAGYSGTLLQWWASVEEQSYASEIRLFNQITLPQLGRNFPHAQDFVHRLLALVQSRFDRVYISDTYTRAISLSNSRARRREVPSKPLRLDGFSLDIEQRGEMLQVRCRLYANSELRRDCNFDFSLPANNFVRGPK